MRLWLALLLAAGCAAGQSSRSAGRFYDYDDSSGLQVTTAAADVDAFLSKHVELALRAVVDAVHLPAGSTDSGGTPDAVTSASATVGNGAIAEKVRVEGIAGATYHGDDWEVGAQVRGSHEQDYQSLSGEIHGAVELAARNTTLSAFVGGGHDTIDPVEAPPGHQDDWPASHDRLTLGGAASQLLSPTMILSAGFGVTWQSGQLASPYRRALVRSTLFPEVVPGTRDRVTGFAAWSWSIDSLTALHLRGGVYADTWGVLALIPEAALVRELPHGLLLTARYRLYRQWRASFYQVQYDALQAYLSGDLRLGSILEHVIGLDASFALNAHWSLIGGIELSFMRYQDAAQSLTASVVNLGVVASF